MLMHTWAAIEHKLSYKKQDYVPDRFKRTLYQLSAMLENADTQLDTLRIEREQYKNNLQNSNELVESETNIDTVQAFLDKYFPDRARGVKDTMDLLNELSKYKITMHDLHNGYLRTKPFLGQWEKREFGNRQGNHWAQVGVIRHILDVTHAKYFRVRQNELPPEVLEGVILDQRELEQAESQRD